MSSTELRLGIGLCDHCLEPRWPQEYVGYGIMLCADCIRKLHPEWDTKAAANPYSPWRRAISGRFQKVPKEAGA